MRILLILLILAFLNSCSFDNKTGIWSGDKDKIKTKEIKKKLKNVIISNKVNVDQIPLSKKKIRKATQG